MVLDSFPQWQKPTHELQNDPAELQRYVQAMIMVAQVFAERLGSPELLDRLVGTDESNPLLRWQGQLKQAQSLMSELHYREARELLANLLIDVRDLKGSGADTYLPITLGHLGQCYFHDREAEKAVPHLEQALHHCEQVGDKEGVVAYCGNLYEVYRYLGQSEVAVVMLSVSLSPLKNKAVQLKRHAIVGRQGLFARVSRALGSWLW